MKEELKISYYFSDTKNSSCPEIFKKIQYPWEAVLAKNKIFKSLKESKIEGKISQNVVISGKVLIGKNTIIELNVVIEGPAILGKNCLIRPHAWIRKNTIIGNDCVVGHGVELKNSLLFNKAKIGTNCFVGDSILGFGARVGSGTILGNRRFDQKIVKIKINEKVFLTGTDKFGAILGDFVRLGTGVLTSPATLIGMHTWIYGGARIKGFISSSKLVKVRQSQEMVDKERMILKDVDLEGER